MFIIRFIIVALITQTVEPDGFADKVFKKINVQEGTACYRLLNGTHQYGCQASDHNQNGLVVEIKTKDDLIGLQTCFRSVYENYNGPFWILLPVEMLERDTVAFFKTSSCIAGLALYNGPKTTRHVGDSLQASHDSACPNGISDYYYKSGKQEYCSNDANSKSAVTPEGLLNNDWKLQIVYLQTEEDYDVVKKCYELFNKPQNESDVVTYPFCGMSFRLANSAAGNSEICFRRGLPSAKLVQLNIDSNMPTQLCSPLSGKNIFSFPTPILNDTKLTSEPKYMMIATRLDSFGVVPEISPGEVSVITSLISSIVAARSIGTNLEKWVNASYTSNKHLVFAAFNGESFDYIGSGALAFYMQNDNFPVGYKSGQHLRKIGVEQIDYIVEPQQLGSTVDRKIFVHADGERYSNDKRSFDVFLNGVEKNLKTRGFDLVKPNEESRVPSSSWHSFASVNKNVQAFLITPFGKKYEYNRYNSMLDRNIRSAAERQKAIDEIVAVSSSILTVAGTYVQISNVSEMAKVDEGLVEVLFDCLVNSTNWNDCNFTRNLDGDRFIKVLELYSSHKKSTYVSVLSENPLHYLVHSLFYFALGSDKETLNVKDRNSCMHLEEYQAMYTYSWQPNPYTGKFSCLRSSTQFIDLISPAFAIDGYSLSKNTTYSTWVESVYTIDSLRLFLVEDNSFDTIIFFISLFVFLLSILVIGRCSESTFIIDEGEPAAEGGEPL